MRQAALTILGSGPPPSGAGDNKCSGGVPTNVGLDTPQGVAVDSSGADTANNRVRRVFAPTVHVAP